MSPMFPNGIPCIALTREVFELLWRQLKPEHRWVDQQLFEGGMVHHLLLLDDGWSKMACFYVSPETK